MLNVQPGLALKQFVISKTKSSECTNILTVSKTLHIHHSVHWSSNIQEQEELNKKKTPYISENSVYKHLVCVFTDVRSDARTPLLLPSLHQTRAFGCLCTPARRGWRWSHTSVCPVEPVPTSGSRPERPSSSNNSEQEHATWRCRQYSHNRKKTLMSQTTRSGIDWYSLIMTPM